MVAGDVGALFERQAIETVGQAKDGIDTVFQAEIGLESRVVEGIVRLLVPLCPVAEVPGLQFTVFESVLFRISEDVSYLPTGGGEGRLQQALQEGLNGPGVLGHTVLGAIGGPARVAQQLRDPDAQVGDFPDDGEVVVVTSDGPGVVGQVQLPLERPVAAVFQERGVAGMRQVEGPAALALLLRRLGGSLFHEIREVGDARFVGDIEGESVGRS